MVIASLREKTLEGFLILNPLCRHVVFWELAECTAEGFINTYTA